MQFTNIKNFSISGEKEAFLKYMSDLRFGAFTPASGKIYEHGNNYF